MDWRLRDRPEELLVSYGELLRWAWTTGAATPGEARALMAWGREHPRAATRVLRAARAVREDLASLFVAADRGAPVPAGALEALDPVCRRARAAQCLRAAQRAVKGSTWCWRNAEPEPERPVWAAVLDACRLLTSSELARVRQCADAECGWFFLDTSKNRSRRWCSMESCGNRNKARRFYRRAKGEGSGRSA